MLKLIVSQADQSPEIQSFPREMALPVSHEPFSATVHPKGPLLYIMTAQDPSHYLECDLTLEVETSQNEVASSLVICHFPQISDEALKSFINEDDTLFGSIKAQFQMKIMEQLFLFCANHYASRLVIYADDEFADDLMIYREFLACGAYTISQQEDEDTEMVVPVNEQIYGDWLNYMNQESLKFRQTLWQGQRSNQAIKQYLKFHPF